MKHVLSYVVVAALLVGCGPSLNQVARTTQAFAVQQRCSQGPFEIHVPAFGSKWGEDVTLEARGGAIDGHSTVTIDGTKYDDRTFSNGSVNNAACMLSDADRAAAVTGGNPVTMPADTSTATSTTTNSNTNVNANANASVALVPAGLPNNWLYQTQIAKYHYEVNDLSGLQGVLKRGQDIAIVFWSERPIDLQATTFVVVHSEMVAPDGDAKWQAHLEELKADNEKKEREAAAEAKKKQLEAEADAKKQRLEAEAKWREEERCRAAQGADKKCHDEGYKTDVQRLAYVLKPGETEAPPEVQKAFDTVKAANRAASAALKPGAKGVDVDRAGRKVVTDAGYPEYVFATGHPIGFYTHDLGPLLAPDWPDYGKTGSYTIEADQTYAVEPGLRTELPWVFGGPVGLGLEEDYLVTATGSEPLGKPQETLILIPSPAAP